MMTDSKKGRGKRGAKAHTPGARRPEADREARPRVSRRSVLCFLFGAVAGEFINATVSAPLADRFKARILHWLRPQGTTIDRGVLERLRLAFELFLSSEAATEFIPPRAWDHAPPDVSLSDGTATYEHEYEVLRSIARVMSSAPVTWDARDESWLAHADSSQVFLASGRSNEGTRWVIGEPDRPIWAPRVGDRTIGLNYSIANGIGSLKRLQYGQELERSALAICDSMGRILAQAEVSSGWQRDDYLLVTRLPGPHQNTVLTILAGLHGPGTRSAEMLFDAISSTDLNQLASSIGHESGRVPYYQAVFRASRFQQIRGSDVPTSIELVTQGCPPRRLSS